MDDSSVSINLNVTFKGKYIVFMYKLAFNIHHMNNIILKITEINVYITITYYIYVLMLMK